MRIRNKIFGAAAGAVMSAGIAFGGGAASAQDAVYEVKVMTPEMALSLAQATLEACRAKGYQVAVAVVDRFGIPQVLLRDRIAGAHTPDTATRKAWTAVSFRTDTQDLTGTTGPDTDGYGLRQITNALVLGGGIVVEAQGGVLGGIGVSGAPGGAMDHECAKEGLESLAMELEF